MLDGTWVSQDEVWLLDTSHRRLRPQRAPGRAGRGGTTPRAKLDSGELHVYAGPLNDNEGNERLAAGETLDSLQAYAIDWPVDGVTGISPV